MYSAEKYFPFFFFFFLNCHFRVLEDFLRKRKNNKDPLLPSATEMATERRTGSAIGLVAKHSNKMISNSSGLFTIYFIKTHQAEKRNELKSITKQNHRLSWLLPALLTFPQVSRIWFSETDSSRSFFLVLGVWRQRKGVNFMPLLFISRPLRPTMRTD